jgi:ABC-type nitrate/sulfonate/bicarbonate transport system substrate-binding protein
MCRKPVLLIALLACAVGLATIGAHSQEATTIGSSVAYTQMPHRIAVEKGYFAAEGLTPDLKIVPAGNDVVQALAGGSMDFGEASPAIFISAIANNLPIVAIGVHSAGNIARLVASPANAALTSIGALKGKRIGVQVGSGSYILLLMALHQGGLATGDVTLANVRVNDMPAAMQSGAFDAVMVWEPQASRIVKAGLGTEVISPKQFEDITNIEFPFLLLTTAKMVGSRPETVQKYLNAVAKAQRFIVRQPNETVASYRNTLPADVSKSISDADLRSQIYSSSRYDRIAFTTRDTDELRRTAEFMLREKMLKAMPDLDKWVNLPLAKNAAANLGN